jgi:hypothetical protein
MKPLLIGEASTVRNGRAFDGRPGLFLAGLLGMTLAEFLDAFDTVNLLRTWPGRQRGSKGHLFPMDKAVRAAARLKGTLNGRPVVLAGKRVARAFGIRAGFLDVVKLDRSDALLIPHPSGVVRHWNDKVNCKAVARRLWGMLKQGR